MSKFRRVADGIYRLNGHFYHRPYTPMGGRTWRALDGATLKAAKANLHRMNGDALETGLTVGEAIRNYRAADCPDKRRQPRVGKYLTQEQGRCDKLLEYWGAVKCSALTSKMIDDYADWRIKHAAEGRHGGRAADLDIVALRNALRWATRRGDVRENPFEKITVSSYRKAHVRHCREVAPVSGDELHAIAGLLFGSESRAHSRAALGWLTLITAMVGCRVSEMTALRSDAGPGEPGHISDGILWLRRKKKGANNFFRIHKDLQDCLDQFFKWREKKELSASPWWFPGRTPKEQLSEGALTHALNRAGETIAKARRTAHGLRSFYVTCRRSAGLSDAEIALETGQVSGGREIVKTYGEATPVKVSWLPSEGKPAWELYQFYTKDKPPEPSSTKALKLVPRRKNGEKSLKPFKTVSAVI